METARCCRPAPEAVRPSTNTAAGHPQTGPAGADRRGAEFPCEGTPTAGGASQTKGALTGAIVCPSEGVPAAGGAERAAGEACTTIEGAVSAATSQSCAATRLVAVSVLARK